jgi:hypothetical protein
MNNMMDILMSGKPTRDVGVCRGCKEGVAHFVVVVSGNRCPKCKGPESDINWWGPPAGYLGVHPEDRVDPGAWSFNVDAALRDLR